MTAWAPSEFALSVPSKAFILGEYAVLRSGQALVATLPPRFELFPAGSGIPGAKPLGEFSERSPARLLIQSAGGTCANELLEARFRDPHQGSGGFGGSTAEFALAYAAIHGPADVSQVWAAYRKLQPQASGADLAAQWTGGAVIADPRSCAVEKIQARHLFDHFFVFSAAHQPGRKVRTHEHLEALERADLDQLVRGETLAMGLRAARAGDFDSFARAINDYGQQLRAMGFEHPRTTEDRAALRDVPGVCAVKGTGAMQADALVVFGDPELRREDVLRALLPVAQARDLKLVAAGWSEERGISR